MLALDEDHMGYAGPQVADVHVDLLRAADVLHDMWRMDLITHLSKEIGDFVL